MVEYFDVLFQNASIAPKISIIYNMLTRKSAISLLSILHGAAVPAQVPRAVPTLLSPTSLPHPSSLPPPPPLPPASRTTTKEVKPRILVVMHSNMQRKVLVRQLEVRMTDTV